MKLLPKFAFWTGFAGLTVIIMTLYIAKYSETPRSAVQHHDRPQVRAEASSTENLTFEAETDDTVAKLLETKVRVLIWVMTSPKSVERARTVKATWGKRCKQLLFFSSQNNTELPNIALNVSEGREHLTAKTVHAYDYIYKHHYHDAEWFMKADDDTYVIVENLLHFLADKNASMPWYTGQLFVPHVKQGFQSGGAGYILSKEALRRFAHRQLNPPLCAHDGGREDVNIGLCMEKLGVRILSSKDSKNRSTFHAYGPEHHVLGSTPTLFNKFDPTTKAGPQHISEFAITFHYIRPSMMRLLDFYLYHLHPFGISRKFNSVKSTSQQRQQNATISRSRQSNNATLP